MTQNESTPKNASFIHYEKRMMTVFVTTIPWDDQTTLFASQAYFHSCFLATFSYDKVSVFIYWFHAIQLVATPPALLSSSVDIGIKCLAPFVEHLVWWNLRNVGGGEERKIHYKKCRNEKRQKKVVTSSKCDKRVTKEIRVTECILFWQPSCKSQLTQKKFIT